MYSITTSGVAEPSFLGPLRLQAFFQSHRLQLSARNLLVIELESYFIDFKKIKIRHRLRPKMIGSSSATLITGLVDKLVANRVVKCIHNKFAKKINNLYRSESGREKPTLSLMVTERMIIFLASSLFMLLRPSGSILAARWPRTWYDLKDKG